MARRRRESEDGLVELLFDISERFPIAGFVISAVLALVGVWLTWVSPRAIYGLGKLFGILSFVAAVALGVTAGIAFVRIRLDQRKRADRFDNTLSRDSLRDLNWREFEQLVADLFRRQGYRVREVGGTADGGVDLVLESPGGGVLVEHLVQCKQYRVWDVGEPKVREFYGAMAAHKTRCEGIVVTCGRFTEPARRFAEGKPLRLIDGDELIRMVCSANIVAPSVTAYTSPAPARSDVTTTEPPTPSCPSCGSPMMKRVASRGAHAGKPFWGCSGYPRCRGIRPS